MTKDELVQKRDAIKFQFDSTQSQRNQVQTQLSQLDTELVKLNGQWELIGEQIDSWNEVEVIQKGKKNAK